jgi:methionine-rich copper-binding protein CopC
MTRYTPKKSKKDNSNFENLSPLARRQRRRVRIFAVIVVVSVVLSMFAGIKSASAHASVLSVSPSQNSVLSSPPPSVSVSFNEPVSVSSSSKIQLLNSSGVSLKVKFSKNADGSKYTLTPSSKLASGSYALRWAVISQDGHPVSGASSFWVGKTQKGTVLSCKLSSSSKTLSLSFSTNRRGLVEFSVPDKTSLVEFRQSKIGAALAASIKGTKASIVIPIQGSYNVSLLVRESEFSEQRFLGSCSFKQ